MLEIVVFEVGVLQDNEQFDVRRHSGHFTLRHALLGAVVLGVQDGLVAVEDCHLYKFSCQPCEAASNYIVEVLRWTDISGVELKVVCIALAKAESRSGTRAHSRPVLSLVEEW